MNKGARIILSVSFLVACFAGFMAVYATGNPVRADTSGKEDYASPIELLVSRDGRELYVLCQQSDRVRVLDAETHALLKTIAVGHLPRGFALSQDGHRLFVANSWDDTLSVIDTGKLTVTATWRVGDEPSSVVEDRLGKRIFVANRISNDVAVLDANTGAEQKRLLAGRGTSYLALSPDGETVYATHIYPALSSQRSAPESEITVIDAIRAVVVDRIPMHGIAGVFHVALSTDGRLGVAAELHPKNLIPLAQLEHGWAFADSLTLFGPDVGKPVEIPLDELERYASRPFGVAITSDKSRIFITTGGSENVVVIDVVRLMEFIRSHPGDRPTSFVQDLSASANYVVARIPVGHDPRGLVLSPDGGTLFVANRLDDTISVIDTRSERVISSVPLAEPQIVSSLLHGEQMFYTSDYSFHGQIGCANCHIDSTLDAIAWDLEPNGFGRGVVDAKLVEDLKDTEPYKWNGSNPNLPAECGPNAETYFWHSETFDNRALADISAYVLSLPSRPNRWQRRNPTPTPAEVRGRAIFERTIDKTGQPIPETNRCSFCHSGPKGTSQKSFDVGTRKTTDDSGIFDTPQLTNIALTAPYLHDGSARSLEEIWTLFNPDDQHGRTNDLNKDNLNDLIEYLKTR